MLFSQLFSSLSFEINGVLEKLIEPYMQADNLPVQFFSGRIWKPFRARTAEPEFFCI